MAKILFPMKTTKNMIENAAPHVEKVSRGYLGMSGIGGACGRKLWLGFRWAKTTRILTPRQKRIFQRGDIEESRVIAELKTHGIEVFRKAEDGSEVEIFGIKGEPQEEFVACFGHAKGHCDGRARGIPEAPKTTHGLEIKTMASKYWEEFSNKGLKKSHPVYYAQTQRYMKAMGDVNRFLIIATDKNTEKREYERIYYDESFANDLVRKEEEIITSDSPYGRKFPRTDMICKGVNQDWTCNYYDICHNDVAPDITCRSCEHSDRAVDGVWLCDLRDDAKVLTMKEQLDACKFYRRAF